MHRKSNPSFSFEGSLEDASKSDAHFIVFQLFIFIDLLLFFMFKYSTVRLDRCVSDQHSSPS